MSAWLKDGQSVRFGPNDHPPGSLQRAIAESVSKWHGAEQASTAAPVAPTLHQVLDGDTAYTRRYNERIENAWRDLLSSV